MLRPIFLLNGGIVPPPPAPPAPGGTEPPGEGEPPQPPPAPEAPPKPAGPSKEELDAAKARAARWGDLRADDAPDTPTAAASVNEPAPTSAALDSILARRRRASA